MRKKKPVKRPSTIKASRIELTDSEGRTRIMLDAGGKEGHASICLFATDGKSVQISSQPEGAITIQVFGRRCRSHITIGLSGDERGGISISDASGKLGTILGKEPGTSTSRLLLFRRGQHFWSTPSGKKARRRSRTIRGSERAHTTAPVAPLKR